MNNYYYLTSSITPKQVSLLKLELFSFISVLLTYYDFLLKTQNFIFRPQVLYPPTRICKHFLICNPSFFKINWASVERHIYKLQRIIFFNERCSHVISLRSSKSFLASIAAHLFISRFLFNSTIVSMKKLNTYQKFKLATSFNTGDLIKVTGLLKQSLTAYLNQHLLCLIVEPHWKGRVNTFHSFRHLGMFLSGYSLRLDLQSSLQSIKLTVFSTFISSLLPEIQVHLLCLINKLTCTTSLELNLIDPSIYSSLTKIIIHYVLKYISIDSLQSISFTSCKGILLFTCRNWYLLQNLEVKLKAWLANIFYTGWDQKITFSYHRNYYQSKKILNNKFDEADFFCKYFSNKFRLKPSLSLKCMLEILDRVKYILYRFHTEQGVVSRILVILKKYSIVQETRSFYVTLFFQLRYKLIRWVLRKHCYLKNHKSRKQYVQQIIKQLKFKLSVPN